MNVNRWIAFTIGLAAAGALLQPSRAPARRASSHIASSPQTGGANRIVRGYPLILAAGAGGGVWYGGNRSGSAEPVDQVGYITPGGAFLSFRLGSELANHWPEYFARAKDGGEWFLAEARGVNLPLLAEISPRGHVHVLHLALDPSTEVRGLALGADGNLWSTATRIRGLSRESALLRISPVGTVTMFRRGLQRGAIPENITAARGKSLWFTDAVGRIGRIDTTGRIQEFALGRQIVASTQRYAPTPALLAARDGTIWFIAGPRTLGHLIAPGRVHLFNPRSSYRPPQDAGERGNLVGLAAAPEGGVWLTRESGEVAGIDAHGRLTTLTNRLLNAYGIAFGRGGVVWVGAASSDGEGEYETPARLARLAGPSGPLTQFPPRPKCEAPALIGLDRQFAEQAVLGNSTSGCEERVLLGRVRIIHAHRAGLWVVVSQSPRAGTASEGYLRVSFGLERESPIPPPGVCAAPRFFQRLVISTQLIVWKAIPGTPEDWETYYGCAPPRGPVRTIATTDEYTVDGSSVGPLASAGHLLGFVFTSGGRDGGSQSLEIYDVAAGQRAFSVTTDAWAPYNGGPEPLLELRRLGSPVGRGVHGFALDANGDIAWLGRAEGTPAESQPLVLYLHDHSGTRKLDVAREINKLALQGGQLTWEAEGAQHSAPA